MSSKRHLKKVSRSAISMGEIMRGSKKMLPHAIMAPSGMDIPDFYNNDTEEALVDKILWVQEQFHLSDQFFSKLLRVHEGIFREWKTRDQKTLTTYQRRCLREFWVAMTHILSHLNFRRELVQALLEFESDDNIAATPSAFTPPWIGTSLKSYLESSGINGVGEVTSWVQGLRYASSF
jgi:hypothetical protein